MKITLTQKTPQLCIMHLNGKLDGSNYKDLLSEAEKLYESGSRDVILDLSHLEFISSAGIAALHRVAIIFRGLKLNAEGGESWLSSRSVARELKNTMQKHVKFYSSTENVRHSLEIVGFDTLFETFIDIEEAVASFDE